MLTIPALDIAPAIARLSAGLCALVLAACTTSEQARQANDPLEPLNREIYQFNLALDDAVLEPASEAYVAVTPEPARHGVRNFMDNLNQPVVFVNTLLQGKLEESADTLARFALNTVFGLAGLVDVASQQDIPEHREDFGQTLAVWGFDSGPYLMLPVLGPSNVRDGVGRFADRYPHPLNWNEEDSREPWAWGVRALNGIDLRARSEDALTSLEAAAIDPYVQVRSAYRQMREREIANGETDEFDDLPDFSDE